MRKQYESARTYLASHPERKAKAAARWKAHAGSHKKMLREFVNREKMKPCGDCGVQYNPWVMQFDHREPKSKLDTIANLVGNSRSLEVVKTEIAKCDVVCANCHSERTHRQRINKQI
jgi:hypothetical protein